jgi:cytoskeleton protein RodZ
MSDSIGQRLKQARKERNLSIEKAEQLTRIRAHYIQALESDDYSGMSSAAQARGFLRNYSEFLGMNIDEILDELQRARTPSETEQFSGPLASVDNASPLPVLQEEEKPARPFLASVLNRFRKGGSASETESQETVPEVEAVNLPEPVIEEPKSPKTRERKKKIDPTEPKTKRVIKSRKKEAESQETVIEPPAPVVVEEPIVEEITEIKVDDAPPQIEEKAKPGLLSRFGSLFSIRVSNPNPQEDALGTVVEEPVSVQVDEVKTEDETPQVEGDQVEVPNEANVEELRPSLLAKVIAFARIRLAKPNPKDEVEEVPEVIPALVDDAPELPKQSAEEIFAEVGAELRKRRDLLSLTVEEVERHTHMRAAFIKAMEDGVFDKLPSPVQTRGMLTNYATFLDLDADALLLRFADALQARHRLKYPDRPAGSTPPMDVVSSLPFLRSYVAGDMLFGVLIVAMLFALALWGVGRMIAIQTAEQALPTAPSIPEVLAGSPQATDAQVQTFIPVVDTPFAQNGTPAGLPTLAANVNVQLNIVAMERTFMRVVVDGDEKFNGRVLPGTAYPFEAENQIEVLTGNGAALRITYNGRDLGLMGNYGEVVNRVYSIVGVATPTATLPPTPTNTPPATPTLSVTGTPVPTLTPMITVVP